MSIPRVLAFYPHPSSPIPLPSQIWCEHRIHVIADPAPRGALAIEGPCHERAAHHCLDRAGELGDVSAALQLTGSDGVGQEIDEAGARRLRLHGELLAE